MDLLHDGEKLTVHLGQPVTRPLREVPPLPRPEQPAGRAPLPRRERPGPSAH